MVYKRSRLASRRVIRKVKKSSRKVKKSKSRRHSFRLSSVFRKKMLLGGGQEGQEVEGSIGEENQQKTNSGVSKSLENAIEELIQSLKQSLANCSNDEKKLNGGRQVYFGGHYLSNYLRNFKPSGKLSY